MNDNENKLILDRFIKDWRSGTRNLKLKKAIGREYSWLWNCLRNETWDKTWKVRGTYKEFGIVAGENPKTVYRAVIKWEKNQLINKIKLKRGSGIEIEFLIYSNRVIEYEKQSAGEPVISYPAEERNRTPVSSISDDYKDGNGTPMSTISRETGHPCPQGRTPVSSISKNGKSVSPLNPINYQPKNGNNGTLKETIKNKVFKEREEKAALLDQKTAKFCLNSHLKDRPKAKANLEVWTAECRLMRIENLRTPEEIKKFWIYTRNHHKHWRRRICSLKKLRQNLEEIHEDFDADNCKKENNADAFNGVKAHIAVEEESEGYRNQAIKDLKDKNPRRLQEDLVYISSFEKQYKKMPKVLSPDLISAINDFLKGQKMMNGSKVK